MGLSALLNRQLSIGLLMQPGPHAPDIDLKIYSPPSDGLWNTAGAKFKHQATSPSANFEQAPLRSSQVILSSGPGVRRQFRHHMAHVQASDGRSGSGQEQDLEEAGQKLTAYDR